MNISPRRCVRFAALAAIITLLAGCAGFQVGPGAATGAGLGAVVGGVTARDPVTGIIGGAVVGGVLGSIGDADDGDRRHDRYYRYDQYYRDDRYRRYDRYHGDRDYDRPPFRRNPPVFYDRRCNCYH